MSARSYPPPRLPLQADAGLRFIARLRQAAIHLFGPSQPHVGDVPQHDAGRRGAGSAQQVCRTGGLGAAGCAPFGTDTVTRICVSAQIVTIRGKVIIIRVIVLRRCRPK